MNHGGGRCVRALVSALCTGVARRVGLVGLVVLPALLAGAVVLAPAVPAGAGESRAVVVIDTGGGVRRAVITFSGSISGLEALQRAGAGPVTSVYAGEGYAVCALDGVGNPPDSCLGTPGDPRFWAYHRAPAGAGGWTFSRAGAAATVVRDGDVEGWRFGTGQAPPFTAFCSVVDCAPPPPPSAPPPPPPGPGAASATPGAVPGAAAPGPGPGTPAPGPAGAPGDLGDPGATATDGSTPGATGASAGTSGRNSSRTGGGRGDASTDDRRALGPRVATDEGGSGSPVGVLVAGGIAVAVVAGTVLVRRRARGPGVDVGG